jgi:hypothetical protein
MLMQSGYKALGWLGIINSAKIQIDFSQMPFEPAFKLLVREIQAVSSAVKSEKTRPITGKYTFERTLSFVRCSFVYRLVSKSVVKRCSTLLPHYSVYNRNVHEWDTIDVIEWLKREKLELYVETTTNKLSSVMFAQLNIVCLSFEISNIVDKLYRCRSLATVQN